MSIEDVTLEQESFELHRVTREGKAQLEIKIGDDKEAFTGKKTYHLSYLLRVLDKTNAFWHQYLIFKTYLFGWLILLLRLFF